MQVEIEPCGIEDQVRCLGRLTHIRLRHGISERGIFGPLRAIDAQSQVEESGKELDAVVIAGAQEGQVAAVTRTLLRGELERMRDRGVERHLQRYAVPAGLPQRLRELIGLDMEDRVVVTRELPPVRHHTKVFAEPEGARDSHCAQPIQRLGIQRCLGHGEDEVRGIELERREDRLADQAYQRGSQGGGHFGEARVVRRALNRLIGGPEGSEVELTHVVPELPQCARASLCDRQGPPIERRDHGHAQRRRHSARVKVLRQVIVQGACAAPGGRVAQEEPAL